MHLINDAMHIHVHVPGSMRLNNMHLINDMCLTTGVYGTTLTDVPSQALQCDKTFYGYTKQAPNDLLSVLTASLEPQHRTNSKQRALSKKGLHPTLSTLFVPISLQSILFKLHRLVYVQVTTANSSYTASRS